MILSDLQSNTQTRRLIWYDRLLTAFAFKLTNLCKAESKNKSYMEKIEPF